MSLGDRPPLHLPAWRPIVDRRRLVVGTVGVALVALVVQASAVTFNPDSQPAIPLAPPPGEEIGIEALETRSEGSLSSRGETRPLDGERGGEVVVEQSRSSYQLDGRTPLPGMISTLGKPGQLPLQAPIVSTPGARSPSLYADVIDQFGVEGNPRYAQDRYTYCNTFAGDVARAMGLPFPTKAELLGIRNDRATVGAADLFRWLTTRAGAQGWREVDVTRADGLQELKDHVNAGKPAFAADPGHVVVIRPGQEADSVLDLRISQAGKWNLNDVPLGRITEGERFKPRFFVHD